LGVEKARLTEGTRDERRMGGERENSLGGRIEFWGLKKVSNGATGNPNLYPVTSLADRVLYERG